MIAESVQDFHEFFNLPVGNVKVTDNKDMELRRKLITEEYNEVVDAFRLRDDKQLLKELCDLVYVAVGTAVALGYDFNEAFMKVHESNMSKLDNDGLPVFREDGKLLKGPNYKPADLSDCVPHG